MAYSNVTFAPLTEAQTNFTIPFSYLHADHLAVYVDGVDASFTFLDTFRVQLDTAAPIGAVVKIERVTPVDKAVVDFEDGSVLGEADLDDNALQMMFVVQEAYDSLTGLIQTDETGAFDALNKRIHNLADPTGSQDAATKSYVDSGVLAPAYAARDAAIAARDAATAARDTALSHSEASDVARGLAVLAQAAAELAQAAAESAQGASEAAQAAAEQAVLDAQAAAAQATINANAILTDVVWKNQNVLLQAAYGDEPQTLTGSTSGGQTVTRNHVLWTLTEESWLGGTTDFPFDGTYIFHVYPNGFLLNYHVDFKLPADYPDFDVAAGEVRIAIEVFNGRKSIISIMNMAV